MRGRDAVGASRARRGTMGRDAVGAPRASGGMMGRSAGGPPRASRGTMSPALEKAEGGTRSRGEHSGKEVSSSSDESAQEASSAEE
jgi:hypothetical protein